MSETVTDRMRIIWTHDGNEKTWDIAISKFMNVEMIAVERATGLPVPAFIVGVYSGSMLARTALLWILRKREEPTLKFDEVELEIGGLDIQDPDEDEPETAEVDEAPKALRKSPKLGGTGSTSGRSSARKSGTRKAVGRSGNASTGA